MMQQVVVVVVGVKEVWVCSQSWRIEVLHFVSLAFQIEQENAEIAHSHLR